MHSLCINYVYQVIKLGKNVYQAINDGKSPLKIPTSCKTCWLSIEVAVQRVISQ